MPHVAPAQILPTNPCDEQIATKNGHLLATWLGLYDEICFMYLGVVHNIPKAMHACPFCTEISQSSIQKSKGQS